MAYNPELRVPFGYRTARITLGELRDWLLVHHHPEFVRRLLAWLTHKGGFVGVGGGYREVQPDKDGFAPEGKSFHQDQTYSDGFVGAAAVDLVVVNGNNVHRAPRWSDVPAQGSAEAKTWGVHCNVGTEPWHMQPIEIDGWQSWKDAGSPAPEKNYPIPGDASPVPSPSGTAQGVRRMFLVSRQSNSDTIWFSPDGGLTRHGVRNLDHLELIIIAGAIDGRSGDRLEARGAGGSWKQIGALGIAGLNARLGKAA